MIGKNTLKTPVLVKKASMASLRLQKDLQSYEQSPIQFIKLIFPEEGNIQKIEISITLINEQKCMEAISTPYNNTKTKFLLVFPDTYPMEPPKLSCLNKIYHPNINYSGKVCLPLVREDWSPTVTLFSIICGLIYILQYPNYEDALEPQIGDQMKSDEKLFGKIVEHTIAGRNFRNKQYDDIIISQT